MSGRGPIETTRGPSPLRGAPVGPPPPAEPLVVVSPSLAMTATFNRQSGRVSVA